MRSYNAFPRRSCNDDYDEERIRNQLIATRIYLLVQLIIMMMFIVITRFAMDKSDLIVIENPRINEFEKLINGECRCNNISVSYSSFVSIESSFDSICSSDFVDARWIEFVDESDSSMLYYPFDFRWSAASQFVSLSLFCNLSREIVDKSTEEFLSSRQIGLEVMSWSSLQSSVESSFNEFKSNRFSSFSRQRHFVSEMIINNQLLSGLETNFIGYFVLFPGYKSVSATIARFKYQQNATSSICYCRNENCLFESGIYKEANVSMSSSDYIYLRPYLVAKEMSTAGLISSCYPIESLLHSTLECLRDQLCVDHLTSLIYLNKMNRNQLSRPSFQSLSNVDNRKQTIEDLLKNLMLQNWSISEISFEKYYAECSPSTCQLIQVHQRTFVNILTLCLSFYGGLILILRFLIPRIVERIRQRRRREQISFVNRLYRLVIDLKERLINLNLFVDPSTEPNDVESLSDQRLSTRLFVLMVVVSLCVLSLYSSIGNETRQKTIHFPNEIQVEQLKETNFDSMSCLCNQSSISYEKFVSMKVSYHQICSSIFINRSWISFLESPLISENITSFYENTDLRLTGSSMFRILAILCDFVEEIVAMRVNNFLGNQLVSTQLADKSLFQSKIESKIENWKMTTVNSFILEQERIRKILHGNEIMSGFLSNYVFVRSYSYE